MRMRLLDNFSQVELLAALHAKCFAETWSAEWLASLLAQPGTFACLAEDDSGFILIRVAGDESEILTLAVEPAARRHGIGAALVAAGAGEAAGRGAKRLFLEVGSTNFAAGALYRRLGFAEVGRRKDYYTIKDGGMEDALVLLVEIPLLRVGNHG
jgi:[ribosomal protein S18]-alanine N-acetyltransferase